MASTTNTDNGGNMSTASQRGQLRIGTRNSKLALVQANGIAADLSKLHPAHDFVVSTHKVQGDADKNSPFLKLAAMYKDTPNATKSLWTMEIEERLLANDLDIIVNCLKDMPTVLPENCMIGVFPERPDPTDALVVRSNSSYRTLDDLPVGSVVGTSSVRRRAQLAHYYPGLIVKECRGNVDSRLAKLDKADSEYTAIVIATAGLVRINLEHRITARLTTPAFLYAVGQGALAIEVLSTDEKTMELIKPLDHRPTRLRCLSERALLRFLQGGCSAPIGVETSFQSSTKEGENGGILSLTGALLHPNGGVEIRSSKSGFVGSDDDAEALGHDVAKQILELGGGDILAMLKDQQVLESK